MAEKGDIGVQVGNEKKDTVTEMGDCANPNDEQSGDVRERRGGNDGDNRDGVGNEGESGADHVVVLDYPKKTAASAEKVQ